MANQELRDLYIDELKDLYSAENQLVKALPKLAKASTSDELRAGFEEHLQQTKGHVERLEQIFEMLGESPKGKKCAGMEGLVEEGSEVMKEDFEGALMDAALIGAAQRLNTMKSRLTARCGLLPRPWAKASTYLCSKRPWRRKRKPTTNSPNWPGRLTSRRSAETVCSRVATRQRVKSAPSGSRSRAPTGVSGPPPNPRLRAGLLFSV